MILGRSPVVARPGVRIHEPQVPGPPLGHHRPALEPPLQRPRGVRPRVAPERRRRHPGPAVDRPGPRGADHDRAQRRRRQGADRLVQRQRRGPDRRRGPPLPGDHRREFQAGRIGRTPGRFHRPVRHRPARLLPRQRRDRCGDPLGEGRACRRVAWQAERHVHDQDTRPRSRPRHSGLPPRQAGSRGVFRSRAALVPGQTLRRAAPLLHQVERRQVVGTDQRRHPALACLAPDRRGPQEGPAGVRPGHLRAEIPRRHPDPLRGRAGRGSGVRPAAQPEPGGEAVGSGLLEADATVGVGRSPAAGMGLLREGDRQCE